MPRQRQTEVNEATRTTIKVTARQLMTENGTAGLSLRAIARQMGMTAPALYHYFPSLDDLITALIVDAFTGHADFIRQQAQGAAATGDSHRTQLFAAIQAYRTWALEHPIDFQLVYGNPIPNYSAPSEVTIPAARRLGEVFMEILLAGVAAGEFTLPTGFHQLPPLVFDHYQTKFGLDPETARLFHLMNYVWGTMHGMVALEIYHHAGPVVGDTEQFYTWSVQRLLQSLRAAPG